MLDQIAKSLQKYPPLDLVPESADHREAAVLLALTDERDPEVVLTLRAQHLKDHAGEVALPGGMWEVHDRSLLQTALRESEEEVSLPRESVRLLARLPTRVTRLGVKVTPYVGVIPPGLELTPELSELDEVFHVPLDFLLQPKNLSRSKFNLAGEEYELPCYHFAGYRIWGFTLALLVEFLNESLQAGLKLVYPPMKSMVIQSNTRVEE